jgi:L-ascorbate metabolism protein UlaG (beta-lactamase superfamily)
MRITFVGHSTVIVESERCTFVTDPILTNRPGRIGPRRRAELKLEEGALEGVDFVLISHGHFDHLDTRSLAMIPGDGPVICHPRLEGIVRRSGGKRALGIDWWETAEVRGVKVTAVPAAHFASRPPFTWRRDFQGYVVESDRTVYHAGDSGMSRSFEEIGERFAIDVALLPIGAYDPPAFRKNHLAPEDALDAMEMVGAKLMIPVHFGTFRLSREPFDEPPKRLMAHADARGLRERITLLRPGESVGV